MSEADYEQAKTDLADLRKQYGELTSSQRVKPYIGQQMARDISRITLAIKKYDRLKRIAGAAKNRR